jgi:hypothetical protein
MEWDGQQRAELAPWDQINKKFPARYEDVEENVQEENLEPDPEAQRLLDDKQKIDAEKRRRKRILNKKYQDKKKLEKKGKREAEERMKRAEEKSTMNWFTEDTDYHTVDEEEENKDEEEQELLEPTSYVMESGSRPSPVKVPKEYEPGIQRECVICGSRGPVDAECDNYPEALSIYLPTNYPDRDVYLIPPIDLTHYGMVMMILDHINQITRATELIFFGSLFKNTLSRDSWISITEKLILITPQAHMWEIGWRCVII